MGQGFKGYRASAEDRGAYCYYTTNYVALVAYALVYVPSLSVPSFADPRPVNAVVIEGLSDDMLVITGHQSQPDTHYCLRVWLKT